VGHEHKLADHAALSQQFVRLSGLGKGKSPRDQWLDLVLMEEIEHAD